MIAVLFPVFFLFLFGFFNLFGINPNLGYTMVVNYIMGVILFFIVKKIGWKFFHHNAGFFYWAMVGILILTYIIGLEVKGSKRWIDLIFFRFQGSELFKVFFIVFLADFFSKLNSRHKLSSSFLISLIYLVIPSFIIFRQPDLGNAMVYVFIFFTLLLFSPIHKKMIFQFIGALFLILPWGWFFLKDYQRNRITSFIWPHTGQQESAYNMIQAMITIGSGRLFGRGLGLGTQSKLYFLPENSTDFAFSSLVEQFGFIGGFAVIIFFSIILYLLLKRAYKFLYKEDNISNYAFLYVIGISALIFFQMFVNVGMNLGILPIAGIALPFISYGGSMVLSLMIGFALIP